MRPMLSCPFARHLIRRTGGSDVSGQMLKLTNTLTGRQEVFTPADDETVRLYTCGPTVYNFVHIGNLRTYVFEDILRRHLASKWKLKHVMNITDIEDRKSTRLNSSHLVISYAVFCLKKKKSIHGPCTPIVYGEWC